MILTLYHGAPGDNILGIIHAGVMRPDASRRIFFSEQLSDALQHGPDLKRLETYALKLDVTLPIGATQAKAVLHGNPRAIVVTSPMPVPVQVLEMYVRLPRQTSVSVVKGVQAIKSYLQKP